MTLLVLAFGADIDVLTAIQLTMIAAFAVLVVFGMIWGARQKRRRNAAEVEAEQHQEELADAAPSQSVAVTPPPPELEPESAAAPKLKAAAKPKSVPKPVDIAPSPPPVAPPPPPLAEALPAAGTDLPLTRLKGLGPKAAALLNERGVADIAALAALSATDAAAFDSDLGAFSGRLSRDRWVEQAKLLTAGDLAAYEMEFGKLG